MTIVAFFDGSQVFGLQSVCASKKNTTKMKFSKVNFVT